MSAQSRRMSLLEAVTSTAIGLLVAYVTQLVAFPLFGIHGTSTGVHVGLTLVFTGVSLVRGYCVRRLFNRIGRPPLVAGTVTRGKPSRLVLDDVENDEVYEIHHTGTTVVTMGRK